MCKNKEKHKIDALLCGLYAQCIVYPSICPYGGSYLIIDNGNHKKIENFIKKYNKLDIEIKNKIKYIIVDGTLKPSASVA